MSYFAMQYRVHFDDTMAYGTHHYMTNFKFQCVARETLLFNTKGADGQDVWQEELKDIILLTQQAYSRNMAPVSVGGKTALILSYEDPTRSTVKLCLRVIREDGEPVAAGFQTIVCIGAQHQELVPAPNVLRQQTEIAGPQNILEELKEPSFAERAFAGGYKMNEVFSPEIIALGQRIAGAPVADSHPRIIDINQNEYPLIGNETLAAV